MQSTDSAAAGTPGIIQDPPTAKEEPLLPSPPTMDPPQDEKRWIRGVNVGGWLMAERFLTPYLFAVNSCHLKGDMCWYPGQVGRHSNPELYDPDNLCDPTKCRPIRPLRVMDGNADYHPRNARPYYDYPVDEYTLGQTFANNAVRNALPTKTNQTVAQMYMERHWDTYVTKQDLIDLRNAGVTHMRVPMSYWIRGDVRDNEPWITGGWPYFVRFAKWTREVGGLEIWADLHGAPGSENGFDNSGQYLGYSTCDGWGKHPENVKRTVEILTDIAQGIADEGLTDVVTGFGLINEPFLDCDPEVVRDYYDQGLQIVRDIMGPKTSVFVGDTFMAWNFNDGFWTDSEKHYDTYLDSHPYHVFFEKGRAFTPKQHIAYVCRHNFEETVSCCYDDPPTNKEPSSGISRIIGEWSAAFDVLPTALTPFLMKSIAKDGVVPLLNRTLSPARMEFMRHFVEAQMVAYEAKASGVTSGWLFWNFKTEGGAFIEWDFLRGIREGWIPNIPLPTVASEDLYGSCYDIYDRTNDEYEAVVNEYPDPHTLDWSQWQGWDATDDFVLSDPNIPTFDYYQTPQQSWDLHLLIPALIVFTGLLFTMRRRLPFFPKGDRDTYEQLK
eukprot:Nitzschia sp. Nitz4//scaffold87_size112219//98155//100063//NITZ4_004089-RA/size112219-snap-gene-0.96-mRNA-1//-1//CDS//3329559414//7600//frame0